MNSRPLLPVLILLSFAVCLSFLSCSRSDQPDDDQARSNKVVSQPDGGASVTPKVVWADYDKAAVTESVNAGQVVMLSFSAEWCINCAKLKREVLEGRQLAERMLDDDVRGFTVDCTNRDAPGWELLREFTTAVPAVVVYSAANADDPVVISDPEAVDAAREISWGAAEFIAAIERSKD